MKNDPLYMNKLNMQPPSPTNKIKKNDRISKDEAPFYDGFRSSFERDPVKPNNVNPYTLKKQAS